MERKIKWQPSASILNLFKRAKIIAQIRQFFSDRGVLEVDTPIMSQSTITDVHLVPFKTHFFSPNKQNSMDLWLTTSPEYHMKRLLAAESGPIYQINHSFRNEEVGRYHNPEFTMLEWYRPHYDMYCLMKEVNDLHQLVLKCEPAEYISYQEVFLYYLGIDPLTANKTQLCIILEKIGEDEFIKHEENRDIWLQLIFTLEIEPKIGIHKPIFIYNFPSSQAGLAKINSKDNRVAERFELYYKGIELANGFCELTDSNEQRQRFELENRLRTKRGLPQNNIDNNLLDALAYGIPYCSGVALGVDRLIMLALKADSINEVIAFPIDRC
ncbi:elongation factor P--(R)-beta-lysine ligase [Pantoea sp. Aalb]|uniref:elongation factor P--(R)-beta-lysine ligase n=1 Tax=Pantoea sp. Aalb TaxID=2576762 RepID=UPI00132AF704|nr:elongation factor P--(R)-beta-lysine ligase [Pantoea sp. Aalb]MXP67805.1 elongation factor P--(R)-beta-lysine ligase [Pantoea sp. Aalb]